MSVTSTSDTDPDDAGPPRSDPAGAAPTRPVEQAPRPVAPGIGGGVRPRQPVPESSAPPPQAAGVSARARSYRRQRFEARKVRRLVRHVDPWSVLKMSLLLALCMWVVGMIASVIIWSVANNTGALASLERFANQNLQLEDFRLVGSTLFRQFGLVSLLGALGFAATMVILALVFNLISDIIGGVWVSVIEEESARPVGETGEPPTGRG